MLELLEKIILAGAGLANLTKEKAEKIVDILVAKGQVQAKDKKAMLGRLLAGTKQLDRELESKIKVVSLNVVKESQKQIDILNKKLAKIAVELNKEKAKKSEKKGKSSRKGK